MASAPRLLVFDLDGTLIDSRIDLTNSVNATLGHFGRPMLPEDTIASYIGDGASTLVRRSLAHSFVVAGQDDPHDETFVEKALDWFLGYYRLHKLDFTTVYPGVLETLSKLRARHPSLPMAVLTNKPVNPSRDICTSLGLAPFFFQNYGGNSFRSKKPKPAGLLQLISEASALTPAAAPIQAHETVMIGDSHFDILTAKNCGARSIGCAYGLAPETLAEANPDAIVNHPEEWIESLGL
jgi:phosphoglycolate phosphatase